jgi:hypothetical protein
MHLWQWMNIRLSGRGSHGFNSFTDWRLASIIKQNILLLLLRSDEQNMKEMKFVSNYQNHMMTEYL